MVSEAVEAWAQATFLGGSVRSVVQAINRNRGVTRDLQIRWPVFTVVHLVQNGRCRRLSLVILHMVTFSVKAGKVTIA